MAPGRTSTSRSPTPHRPRDADDPDQGWLPEGPGRQRWRGVQRGQPGDRSPRAGDLRADDHAPFRYDPQRRIPPRPADVDGQRRRPGGDRVVRHPAQLRRPGVRDDRLDDGPEVRVVHDARGTPTDSWCAGRDKSGNIGAWKAGPTLTSRAHPADEQRRAFLGIVHDHDVRVATPAGSSATSAAAGSSATYTTTARSLSFVTTRGAEPRHREDLHRRRPPGHGRPQRLDDDLPVRRVREDVVDGRDAHDQGRLGRNPVAARRRRRVRGHSLRPAARRRLACRAAGHARSAAPAPSPPGTRAGGASGRMWLVSSP